MILVKFITIFIGVTLIGDTLIGDTLIGDRIFLWTQRNHHVIICRGFRIIF
jgi:hypothetical protein